VGCVQILVQPAGRDPMAVHNERRKANRDQLEQIDERNWQLWMLSFAVTVCLAAAIGTFFYPAIRWHVAQLQVLYGILPQLILGLLTLVFLCIIYITHKQRELNDLRNYLIAIHFEARRLGEEYPKDPLTGVLDRRALPDVLKREVTWVDRYRVALSLALFNIVEFRKVNQAEGNLAADEILKALARALEATVRQTDTILRYSPDRFLCFLPRTDRKGAEAFGRRVKAACQKDSRLRDHSFTLGIGLYEAGGEPQNALAEAEAGLTQATPFEPVPAPAPTGESLQPL
jgi:diguanylate cyclase (GGDEF)-like protein